MSVTLRRILLAAAALLAALVTFAMVAAPAAPIFEGVFWQPDCTSRSRLTDYRKLGASRLILQWTAVEDQHFDGTGAAPCLIDWSDIQAASGHLDLVVGLQGSFHPAPSQFPDLAQSSAALARYFPLPAAAYYAPVELYPGWPPGEVRAYLNALPRPLWVSVYAGLGKYTPDLTTWLSLAVPQDVRILLQDGGRGGPRHSPAGRAPRPRPARAIRDRAGGDDRRSFPAAARLQALSPRPAVGAGRPVAGL